MFSRLVTCPSSFKRVSSSAAEGKATPTQSAVSVGAQFASMQDHGASVFWFCDRPLLVGRDGLTWLRWLGWFGMFGMVLNGLEWFVGVCKSLEGYLGMWKGVKGCEGVRKGVERHLEWFGRVHIFA